MEDKLEKFFAPEITLYPIPNDPSKLQAADKESKKQLIGLIGTDIFPTSQYDDVLSKAGEVGLSLCTIGEVIW